MLNVFRIDLEKTTRLARVFGPIIAFETITPEALAKGEVLAAS